MPISDAFRTFRLDFHQGPDELGLELRLNGRGVSCSWSRGNAPEWSAHALEAPVQGTTLRAAAAFGRARAYLFDVTPAAVAAVAGGLEDAPTPADPVPHARHGQHRPRGAALH